MFRFLKLIPILIGINFLWAYSVDLKIERHYKSGSLILLPLIFKHKENIKDIKKVVVEHFKKDFIHYNNKIYIIVVQDVRYFREILPIDIYLNNNKKITNYIHFINGAPPKIGFVKLDKKRIKLKSRKKRNRKENIFFHQFFLTKRKLGILQNHWFRPIKGKFYKTSLCGKRRRYSDGKESYHRGADYVPVKDKNIYSPQNGVVIFSGKKAVRGNIVIIYHSSNIYTSYWHMSKRFVKKGDIVKKGQKVGYLGSTGLSTGPHLHWEARYKNTIFNPENLLEF